MKGKAGGPGRLPLEEKILAEQLRPAAEEREYIHGVADWLLAAIKESGKAEGMVVGSIARDTWVKGDRDLDVFMLFPPICPARNSKLEGSALARTIARKFTTSFCERYAEHPYINAIIGSIDVDLVPCYNVASAAHIQSAVDRTPFHTRYITEKINGLVDDVLLAKQFAKAGGIYGSDQMTEGFSGYLCELLVLHYGGFAPLLRAASEWGPHLKIDIEHHAAKEFDEPLIVIDPVDPRRNVAAAVSIDRMAEFVELARGYCEAPSETFFTLPYQRGISRDELAEILSRRGTCPLRDYIYHPSVHRGDCRAPAQAEHRSDLQSSHTQRVCCPPRQLPDGNRAVHDALRTARGRTPAGPAPRGPPGLEPPERGEIPGEIPGELPCPGRLSRMAGT